MSLPSKLSVSNNGSDGGSTSSLYVARDEGLEEYMSSEDMDEEAVIILALDVFGGIASC